MSKVLVTRYSALEVLYLIPPDWNTTDIDIRRHNIYHKGKNVTDIIKSVELEGDCKTPIDMFIDDGMKSFFEDDEDLI
jgi:hypothetical protein